MLNKSSLSLSKSLFTRQVNVLSQLYGAVCDKQYILTAKPTFLRRLSDDEKANMSNENTESTSPEPPDGPWRDPYAAKVEIGNPSDADKDMPHNISMP